MVPAESATAPTLISSRAASSGPPPGVVSAHSASAGSPRPGPGNAISEDAQENKLRLVAEVAGRIWGTGG